MWRHAIRTSSTTTSSRVPRSSRAAALSLSLMIPASVSCSAIGAPTAPSEVYQHDERIASIEDSVRRNVYAQPASTILPWSWMRQESSDRERAAHFSNGLLKEVRRETMEQTHPQAGRRCSAPLSQASSSWVTSTKTRLRRKASVRTPFAISSACETGPGVERRPKRGNRERVALSADVVRNDA